MDYNDKLDFWNAPRLKSLQKLSLVIVALFVVSVIPSSILPANAAPSPPQVPRVFSAIIKTIITANPLFNGKPQGHTLTTYVFPPSGQVSYRNNRTAVGNMTIAIPFFAWNGFPQTTAQAAAMFFANATNPNFFKFNYNINIAGHTAVLSMMYKQKAGTADFKLTINGTYSSAGTLRLQFNNNLALNVICSTTSDLQRIQFGSAGFDWADAPTAIADCVNNRLTFPTTTSFRIDPTTIGTSTTAGATFFNGQRKVFFCQTRYWAFYSDGTNGVFRTSTDGVTWTSATTGITGATRGQAFTIWDDCTNTKVYYIYIDFQATFKHRAGTLNTDGTITWDYAQVSVNILHTSGTYGTITKDTSGILWVAFSSLVVSTTDNTEVWKCTISGTNCGTAGNWANSLDASYGTGAGQSATNILNPLTSGKLSLIYQSSDPATKTFSVRTYSGSAWNAAVGLTSTYQNTGSMSAIAISDTTYFAGGKSGGNVLYWSCAYPCGSAPTEVTIATNSGTKDAEISSDNNQEIIIAYDIGGTVSISYQISFNSGTSFPTTVNTLISAESITAAGPSLQITYVKQNNQYEFLWTSASGFNVRFALVAVTVQIIQSKSCTFTGSSGTCAFTSNTLANDAVVVIAGDIVATAVSTVTDTQLLTYSLVVAEDAGTIGDIEGWCAAPTTAAADTITVSYAVSVTATIILYELTTQKCNATSSVGTGTVTTSASVSSYTPSNPVLVIGAVDSTCQVACTVTAGTSYVLDQNVNTGAANKVSTEYIQNFGTAETSPFTFSANSNYNEISMAFVRTFIANPSASFSVTDAFKQGVGKNPSSSFTLSPVFSPQLVLSRTFSAAFSASAKFNQGLNLHPFLPTFTLSPFFDFFRGLTPPPVLLVPQPDYTAYFAMAIMFIFVVLILIKKRR